MSNFPTGPDNLAEDKADATEMETDHAAHHNAVADAVNAVQAYLLSANPPGFFRAKTASAQTVANSTPGSAIVKVANVSTILEGNSEDWYDDTTSRFTPLKAGVYRLDMGFELSVVMNSGHNIDYGFLFGGSPVQPVSREVSPSNSIGYQKAASIAKYFDGVDDYAEIAAIASVGSITAHFWFTAHRVT